MKTYNTAARAKQAAEKIAKNHPNVVCGSQSREAAGKKVYFPVVQLRQDQEWMGQSLLELGAVVTYQLPNQKPVERSVVGRVHNPLGDLQLRWEPDTRRLSNSVLLYVGEIKTHVASVSWVSAVSPAEKAAGKAYLASINLPGYRDKSREIMLTTTEEAGKAVAEKMVRRWLELALAPAPVTK